MRDLLEEIFANNPIDPTEAARRPQRPAVKRRFYKSVGLAPGGDGFAIELDGRPLRASRRFGRIDGVVGEDLFQQVAHVRSTHNCVAAIGSGADVAIHNRSSATASSEKSPSNASTPAAASASDG